MYLMNMESLVCIAVISVLAGWATKPIARLIQWSEGLTENLVSFMRESVLNVFHSGATPSYAAVRSRREKCHERERFARKRTAIRYTYSVPAIPMAFPGLTA
jgi:hypothetical protein